MSAPDPHNDFAKKLAAVRAAATATQPAPKPGRGDVLAELAGTHQRVFDSTGSPADGLLAEALRARRDLGIERYGVPLQHDNGRDYRADALQEALDLYAYIVAGDSSDERLGTGWMLARQMCRAMVQLIAEEVPRG